MKRPSVIHPKRFAIKGILFEVVTYTAVGDAQAGKVAMQFYRLHKFKKSDQGKQFQILWTGELD